MYGSSQAQRLADVDFLADAGRHGWGVLTQNYRMWQDPDEREAIELSSTRVFSLASAQHTSLGKGLTFGRHLLSIRRRMQRDEPCFWRLYPMSATKKDRP
jgi:hypothetical protein